MSVPVPPGAEILSGCVSEETAQRNPGEVLVGFDEDYLKERDLAKVYADCRRCASSSRPTAG